MLILKKNTERGTYARNPAALYEVKQPHEKSPPLKDTIYLSLYKNESLNVFQYTDSRYKSFSSYRAMSSNYPNPGKDSTVRLLNIHPELSQRAHINPGSFDCDIYLQLNKTYIVHDIYHNLERYLVRNISITA